jgi:hypothetical protein
VTLFAISFALAALFAFLTVRDVRFREMGFVFFSVRRFEAPVIYWLCIVAEASFASLCAFMVLAAFLYPAGCDEKGVCTIEIDTDPSADPFATATCPPDGCRMIATEPKPEPEIYP